MHDQESRIRSGEVRREIGVAIVNPYGGLWGSNIFKTNEEAKAFLQKEYPEADMAQFKLAMAVQTTEIYREMKAPDFIPLPLT